MDEDADPGVANEEDDAKTAAETLDGHGDGANSLGRPFMATLVSSPVPQPSAIPGSVPSTSTPTALP